MHTPYFIIVSPVYRAGQIVPELVRRLKVSLEQITAEFEIILVEDGSPDNSWKAIEAESRKDPRVKGIRLSRNFGQHYAISAGLDFATGEWVVVMDCDLQDRPEEIAALYNKAKQGFDVVLARRAERQDSFIKRSSSFLFYRTLSYLTGSWQDPSIANFGLYRKPVIEALRKMREPIRYFPTMVGWVGFRRTTLDVTHAERFSGTSSYNWNKLLRLSLDIILLSSTDKCNF